VTTFSSSLPTTNQEPLDQAAANPWSAPSEPAPPAPDFHAKKLDLTPFSSQQSVGSGFTVTPSQLTSVAGAMGSDQNVAESGLNTLDNEGPLAELVAAGWDTSNALGANAGQAYYGISALTSKLLSTYDEMRAYLHKAATGYVDADDSTAGAANSLGV
jgi:hypothetical protein